MPASWSLPASPHHSNSSSVRATCLRSAFICFAEASSSGRKASLTRTAPSRTDSASHSLRSAIRMICTLPPPTSMPYPSSSVVEFAIAR